MSHIETDLHRVTYTPIIQVWGGNTQYTCGSVMSRFMMGLSD
jgi:hypothetical protein